MPFQITTAPSSRITKTRRRSATSSLRRSASVPSSVAPRNPPILQSRLSSHGGDPQLHDTGIVASLASDLNFGHVSQYMEYIEKRMFSDIPERGAGMNSTRIADVLNYRKALPPIVTIAHMDALSTSSTKTEREMVELTQMGVLRRVTIPNHGVGSAAVGDGIASVTEWQRMVRADRNLEPDLQTKYIALMNANPTSATISGALFTSAELSTLTTSGFLTTSHAPYSRSSFFAYPGAGSLSSLSSSGSRYPAGSLAAVGGASAIQHIAGGSTFNRSLPSATYNFSLPNTGSHIKLLISAHTHLLSLLHKSKYKEAPLDVLCERWDGGVAKDNEQTERKKGRGEFAGLLPGRMKKWKSFWGLKFEWILEECIGAGLVDIFETGSVGLGVRAT